MEAIRVAKVEELAEAEAQRRNVPFIDLKGFPIAPEALTLVPRAESQEKKVLCFFKTDTDVRLAAVHPDDAIKAVAERIAKDLGVKVDTYLISEESFKVAFKLYDTLPEIKEIIYGVRINEKLLETYAAQLGDLRELQDVLKKASTSDLVTLILGGGIKTDTSDIHIEAEEDDVKVRYRIDGDLRDVVRLPKEAWKTIISRFKLLAGVKINVEDVPQDGRITIYISNEKIDIRVSFLPTAFGESVVMRLLRPKSIALEFEQLGVRGRAWETLKKEIEKPNGMIITTGPTGSGKTTTLYAILKRLNTEDVKIITLEEPIEYKLKGVNQSQIDYSKNYTFGAGLRSILRQDPDVVMVGELRDLETAEVAIQAALTGHLVISTIHTNSAAGAVPRFLSMGVKPFLLAPAINCVIGQRLVKRLNPEAKVPIELSPSLLAQVRTELSLLHPDLIKEYKIDLDHLQFYGPKEGHEKPYKGRVGIYEIFSMNKEIEKIILSGKVSEYQMIDIARRSGMVTMAQDGLLKALDGLTTVEEVLRAAKLSELQDTESPVAPAGADAVAAATTDEATDETAQS
jgi:type IV pilus assembly protein PilB